MRKNRNHRGSVVCAPAVLALLSLITLGQSSGGNLRVTSSVAAGGGGTSTGAGNMSVAGSAGQPGAGTVQTGAALSHVGGFWPTTLNSTPTAAPANISGQVTTANGTPLAGVVIRLSGARLAVTITDIRGQYSFASLAADNLYSVSPELVNFTFTPHSLSFSLVANKTDAIFTATASAQPTGNPLDTAEFFVRQQYVDFLGREPDQGGFEYWSAQINQCNADGNCVRAQRISVSAAFFIEQEFQQSGSFIYDLYASALGRRPAFIEYAADRQQVVAGANLEMSKAVFAESFVQRAEFARKYPATLSADVLVDSLVQSVRQTTGVDISDRRARLLNTYASGANAIQSRALVLRAIADDTAVKAAEYNAAFVLAEYFGYLRRDPDQTGFDFWLSILNNAAPHSYRSMVCAFITAAEYQLRFSLAVTHSNAECSQ